MTERPPYDAPVETLGEPTSRGVSLHLELSTGPPSPRYWFQSRDESDLIQIQPNWFACNWRKVSPDAQYANWGARREFFAEYFSRFLGFLEGRGFGPVQPIQCEVTYINHISGSGVWDNHGDVGRVFRGISVPPTGVCDLEQWQHSARYHFRDVHGGGRLHASVDPVFRTETKEPIFALNLTARGAPEGDTVTDVMNFMDLARDRIVRTFDVMTTPEMHPAWGKL